MEKIYRGFITKFLIKKSDWALALFQNEDQGKLQLKIKGNIAQMNPRTRYEISGHLENNQKYGSNLNVKNFRLATFDQTSTAIKYLTSKNFPGVTKPQAELVYNALGNDWLKKIQQNNQVLHEIDHLNSQLIPIIQAGIKRDYQDSLIEQRFQENNLNLHVYHKIKELTADNNEIESLFKNNFLSWSRNRQLGKNFDLDKIALHYGLSEAAPERIAFWLENCVITILSKSGDTYTNLVSLMSEFNLLFRDFSLEQIKEGLTYAKNQKWLYFVNHKIYSAESWHDEAEIVENLISLNHFKQKKSLYQWKIIFEKIEQEVGQLVEIKNFHFNSEQRKCLKEAVTTSVLIISGGPGTGKSTLILGLALLERYLFPEHKINIATPTGRASMRLKTVIPEFNPLTLHRLLEFDENTFHRHQNNPLEANLVIIDEMSMVDNHLFAAFLRAGRNLKKLILVGDVHQLPPVNYGDIFNNLIQSQCFSTCYLIANHRQNRDSGIIKLANAIKTNQLEQLDWRTLPQVEIIFEAESDNLITLKLDYSRYYHQTNLDVMAYQIIAPTYQGKTGINTINQNFQKEFNDHFQSKNQVYVQNENNFFAVNDKIICNRNFPEYDLANGEIGQIKKLEFNNDILIRGIADFGGKLIPLDKELFKHLSLCYACSIHKTQGSEYQKVALVLDNYKSPNNFLNKKLIYTAVTRAKNELLIIAKKETFIRAASHSAIPRSSTIVEKIKNHFKN